MKKTAILFAVCTLLLVFVTADAYASSPQKIRVVLSEWEPYTSKHLQSGGMLVELTRAALQDAGYQPTFHILPWQRAKQTFLTGRAQILLGLFKTPSAGEQYLLSRSLAGADAVLAKLTTTKLFYSELEDVRGKKIGYIRDSGFSRPLLHAGYDMDEAPHEKLNVQKLLAGRVDVILDARDTLVHYLRNQPEKVRKRIEIMEPAVSHRLLCAAFPKTPSGKKLRDAFDKGLEHIHAKGKHDSIVSKYGLPCINCSPAKSTAHDQVN